MEAIVWKDKSVTYKETGSTEVITTKPFATREFAVRFVEEVLGYKLGTNETNN